MKARKKPIEIEYYPCEVKYFDKILGWATEDRPIKIVREKQQFMNWLTIETLEWTHFATANDMVIKWVNWEVYPCKKDIFEETYDRINERTITPDEAFWEACNK